MTTSVSLVTADSLTLEAELSVAVPERARMVLCHPHPLQGGTMQSLVISELFTALPQFGITCLRFNFRGVGASDGSHDDGDGEQLDVQAAIASLADVNTAGLNAARAGLVVLAGWSFGADVALSVHSGAIAGWIAIAPPLSYARDFDTVAQDRRPKLVILGERDEIRDAREVHAIAERWTACTTKTIPGASHFFVGRTDAIIQATRDWVEGTILG